MIFFQDHDNTGELQSPLLCQLFTLLARVRQLLQWPWQLKLSAASEGVCARYRIHDKPFLSKGILYKIIMKEYDMLGGALFLTEVWSWMQVCLYRLHR